MFVKLSSSSLCHCKLILDQLYWKTKVAKNLLAPVVVELLLNKLAKIEETVSKVGVHLVMSVILTLSFNTL